MIKFLIIQTASIGDVILATPVVEKLRQEYPDAAIDFLLKKGNEELFSGHPHIRNLLVWDKRENKYRNLVDLINYIREERYDHVINIQRFAASGLITALSGAGDKVGFSKNPFSVFFSRRIKHKIEKGVHETERNLMLIRHLTNEAYEHPKLYPSAADFAKMSQYKTKRYICIAPASLWFTKQYPVAKWAEFIKNIEEEHIYMIGGPADSKLCDEIIAQSGNPNCLNLAGKLSFLQTAALMKEAVMNYTNDSAPMHMASAMNARVTAIYCSTVPEFGFGPLSEDSAVVQTNEYLACKPCGIHGYDKCPEGHFKCALTINKQQLSDRLNP